MSTLIMSACWPLQGMSPAQKAVLVSLADNANDEGVCWPSVARIAERTCLSERAVQGALRWLAAAGLLVTKERDGRSTMYEITPAAYAPPQMLRGAANAPTPADAAPTPAFPAPAPADAAPRTVKNQQGTVREPKYCPPGDIDPRLLADFLEVRKAKRVGKLTATAMAGIQREADKAGISLQDAVTACVEFGWAGFNAGWYATRAGKPGGQHAAAPRAYGREAENERRKNEFLRRMGQQPNLNVIDMEAPRAFG